MSRWRPEEDEDHEDDADADMQPMPMREAALREVLASGFASADTKVMPQAMLLASMLIRAFVEEARYRAEAQACEEGATEVTDVHLEKILPQLLLDFA